MPTSLVNFNAPVEVRKRFDAICHVNKCSRTSVLVELMANYVLQEGQRLIHRQNEFQDFDKQLQESLGLERSKRQIDTGHRFTDYPRQTWGDAGSEMPSPLFSDGRDDW